MLTLIKTLFIVALCFVSNMALLLLFWATAWYCTPDFFWDRVRDVLVFLNVAPTPENIVIGLSLFTVIVPCFFYRTEPMQALTFWMMGARKAKDKDLIKIKEAMQVVCQQEGTSIDKYKLYVHKDEKALNACAFGSKRIMVTAPLLASVNTRQLAGILAHEAGHIRHGDTRILSFTACMSFFGEMSVNILGGIMYVLSWFTWIPILNLGIAAFDFVESTLIMLITYLVIKPVDFIVLFFFRRDEYNADRYACELGLSTEIYEGLSIITRDDWKLGFFDGLWSTHPAAKKRLARIQKYIENEKLITMQDDKRV